MSNSIEKIKEIARKTARIQLEIAGEKIVRQGRIEQETKKNRKNGKRRNKRNRNRRTRKKIERIERIKKNN